MKIELVRLQSYEREQAELNNVRFLPILKTGARRITFLIQSTRSNLDKLKESNNVLLFITLVPQQKTNTIEVTIKSLALNFFSWLIILLWEQFWLIMELVCYFLSFRSKVLEVEV